MLEVLTIRPHVVAEDASFLSSLSGEAFSEYVRDPYARTEALISGPQTSTWVGLEGDRKVGFVSIHVHGSNAHLTAIAVEEGSRGRGFGRALLQHAGRMAVRHGAGILELVTSQANVAAIELFRGVGFELGERRWRYYQRGQDAVRMWRRLVGT